MTKQFVFFFFPKMPLQDGTFRYSAPSPLKLSSLTLLLLNNAIDFPLFLKDLFLVSYHFL